MNDGLVCGHKLAAVFFGGGQAKYMVVLVDGAAHSAQAVVTVGEDIGQGESAHTGGAGRLNNAHICNVVRRHGVKGNFKSIAVSAGVVALQNAVSDGTLFGLGRGGETGGRSICSGDQRAAAEVHAIGVNIQHEKSPVFK